jgi:hypothetical protein
MSYADALEACRQADEIAASEPESDGIEVWLVPLTGDRDELPIYHALPPD